MADTKQAFVLHSRPAHQVLGWCGRCPDHGMEQELTAWRTRALATTLPASPGPLREVGRCYCQPTEGFMAIPDTGTYLVREGRVEVASVPEPEGPLFANLLAAVVRSVYGQAARALADAPAGAQAEITLTADAPGGPMELGRYEFTRLPEEAVCGR